MPTPFERQRVDALIAECVDSTDAHGILSDLLGECGVFVHPFARHRLNILRLMDACRYGTSSALDARRGCTRVLSRWADTVWAVRRDLLPLPVSVSQYLTEQSARPSYVECEGSDTFLLSMQRRRPSRRWDLLLSRAHVLRLCRRAVEGYEVPPDVEAGTMVYVSNMRIMLRLIAPVCLNR